MLTKVEAPQNYKRLINKEKEKKEVIQIIDDEGFLREVSFDDLTSHPTTLSGYGITDAVSAITSVDNDIVRFDGTEGQIQNSGVTIDDNGDIISGHSIYLTNITGSVHTAGYSKLFFGPKSSPYNYIGANNTGVFGIYNSAQKGVSCYPAQNFFSTHNIDLGRSQSPWKNFYFNGKFYKGSYDYTWPNKTGTVALTSDITDLNLGTAAQKDFTTTILQNSGDLPTGGAVYDAIATAVASAIHYRGISSTPVTDGGTETPTINGIPYTQQDGDVVIYNGEEYLWGDNQWNKLGDDSSYALKTITITGTDGITGGGDLTTNRTLGLTQAVRDDIAEGVTAYGWGNHSQVGYALATDLNNYLPLHGTADAAVQLSNARTLWGQSFNGTANIDGAISNAENITPKTTETYDLGSSSLKWNNLYAKTLYGDLDWSYIQNKPTYAFSDLTSHPSTLSGYGITDAKIVDGTITLGSDSITPLTSFTESDPIFSASEAATITSTDTTNWDTAYGWGDHSQAGYLTSETDPTVPSWAKQTNKPSYNFSEIGSTPITLSGYGITDAHITSGTITLGSNSITPLTSFTETDPIYSASAASGISSSDITNWNGKYDKPAGGIPGTDLADTYLTTETDPVFSASAASGIASSDITNWNGKYTKPATGIPASDLEETYLTSYTETDPTVPSWAKAANKPSYTLDEVSDGTTRKLSDYVAKSDVSIPGTVPTGSWGNTAIIGTVDSKDFKLTFPTKPTYTATEVGALPSDTHIPDDMKVGIVVGKLYRNNVSGTGNISITGNTGYIPTTTVAGTYTVAIYMLSTTQSYTMNVTYGTNTYTLSTTNGLISDVRNLTVAANSTWSASIPGSTPVAAGTYLVVTLYKQMTTATTIGVVAVTNNYDDLDNKPSIPTVNNATLTIQKNSSTVATFTANASSGVTANIEVPTKTSEITNDSGFITSSAIPSNVSAFTNDAGYLTQHQSLAGYTPKTTAIPYIEGPGTDTAGVWTGTTTDFTAYADGLTIIYVPGVAGASGTTLNINGLGAIPCYWTGTSALGTQYAAGTPILFTYRGGCWRRADYNADTVNARGLQSYYERGRLYSASAPLYRYKICGYRDGKIVPLVITNQESATQVNKVPTTIGLDVQRGLVFYSSTTTVSSANGALGAQTLHESYQMTTAAYTFNVSVTTYTDVYLQGSYDRATGLFTLDNTQTSGNYRSYYVFAPKSSGTYTSVFTEGKYYWFVGAAYSTANYIQLKVENPVYYFDGTDLIPVENLPPNISYDSSLSESSTNPIENSAVYRQYMSEAEILNTILIIDPYYLYKQPLTLTIHTSGSLKWYYASFGGAARTIYYKINEGDWTSITSTTSGVYIPVNVGDKVYLGGDNFSQGSSGSSLALADGCTVSISGNIMSLINKTEFWSLKALTSTYQFYNLFQKLNNGLLNIDGLLLPATTLTNYCYYQLFSGAKAISSANIELPATTLASNCYNRMFSNCSSLLKSPKLIAETLGSLDAYTYMFYNCTSLQEITILATSGTPGGSWVTNVPTGGTFYKAPEMTWTNNTSTSSTSQGAPYGWTIADYTE